VKKYRLGERFVADSTFCRELAQKQLRGDWRKRGDTWQPIRKPARTTATLVRVLIDEQEMSRWSIEDEQQISLVTG
jgi:hypothetical protein